MAKKYYNLEYKKIASLLNTDLKEGLFEKEVKSRRKEYGANELPEKKPLSRIKLLLEQFRSPLIYILVLAGIVTLFMGEYTDSIVIFGAVILNTIVGFLQENKVSKALHELRSIVTYKTKVIREGRERVVESSELVPGDIFILESGDRVPADGRIIKCDDLAVNEMALTGEWLPAKKDTPSLPSDTPLADRDNMVYAGTIVEAGKARVITVSTGLKTEMGKIAQMIRETKEEKTPLQKRLAHFSKIIGILIALICGVIFVEGLITGNSFLEMFTTAVAVAVAAIPEGLPVAMTVILALGMERILRRKGLVRRLVAAETLGSTSVICSDKTATLTEGKMKVSSVITDTQKLTSKQQGFLKNIDPSSKKSSSLALKIITLANEAFVENPTRPLEEWVIQGRPTDRALLQAGAKAGFKKNQLKKRFVLVGELPFNSQNKYLAKLHQIKKENYFLSVSGAPEKILHLSTHFYRDGKKLELTDSKRTELISRLKHLMSKGLRVVGVAYRKTNQKKEHPQGVKKLCRNLVFVGFVGLKDPLRKGVKQAVTTCRKAGIKPILVTGDHKLTARTVAKELGISTKNTIEGKELEKMSDRELSNKIRDIEVYARVEPKHKMRIIEGWQEKGEVVAMTGDGINDSPALKKADIGVALGSGTDVAKETSDLILLPDSFNIIVAAVEEGRAILDNIRKVITYLLSDSFTEVILVGGALLFGFPLPLLAVQILWVNLVEDGLPNMALAFEPKEKDLMEREPVQRGVPFLTREMKAIIFIIGIITDLILLGLFFWLWSQSHDLSYVHTMIFSCLTIDSLFYVFSCKSLRRNIWHTNPFSNKFLVGAWIAGILMLIAALYLPPLQTLLKTVPLGAYDWLIIFLLGMVEIVSIEITKWYFISRHTVSKV